MLYEIDVVPAREQDRSGITWLVVPLVKVYVWVDVKKYTSE